MQGSSDALLMAWNLMDSLNKKGDNIFDEIIMFEGIPVNRLLFIDDVVEVSRSVRLSDINNITHEVFQKENRIKYKSSKCKVVATGKLEEGYVQVMNNESIEMKESHKYLGTMVSKKGRKEDFENRVNQTSGVVNEVVEICKRSELSVVRLQYIRILINACVDMKLKYGCEFWDKLNKKQVDTIDKIKVNMMKRILELPYSTPSFSCTT